MELITYILYLMASKNVFLFVFSIIGTIGVFSFVSFWFAAAVSHRPPPGTPKGPLWFVVRVLVPIGLITATVLVVGTLALSIVNLVRPHYIDGQLMDAIGKRTEAKVVRIEGTSIRHNKQPVMRHYVIFKTADGENIDTYFETWDFNVYPSANSVSYPGQGETFGVLYLPSYPTAFLILTDDESSYSKSRECGDILKDLETAKIKFEFDPTDAAYKREFEQATQKAVKANCTGSGTRPSSSAEEELPALTQ